MEPTNPQKSGESGAGRSIPYQSRVDDRPLTEQEKTLWWVMGAIRVFSMLLLLILMALFHTPLAAN